MKNLEISSIRLLQNKNNYSRYFLFGIIIFAFLGFLDTSYLSIKHFQGLVPDCYLLAGCDVVTTSKYSIIFGVPLAYIGLLYYLILFVLGILYIDTNKEILTNYIFFLVSLGSVSSLYFTYLQFFVIGSLCVYCLTSAFFSTIIFVLSASVQINKRHIKLK